MNNLSLEETLVRLDRRPYPAYKDLRGRRDELGPITLRFLSIQGDPFAAPSRLRIDVSPRLTGLPTWSKSTSTERIATADFIHRIVCKQLRKMTRVGGSGKSGRVDILQVGQEILERSALQIAEDGGITIFLTVGLPAAGRRILGRAAATLLVDVLPEAIREVIGKIEFERLQDHIHRFEDQRAIRVSLKEQGLVAFVADGSVLPRVSGVDDRPLENAVAFTSPESLVVEVDTPHSGVMRGMGIRHGITMIVGGGYHGKSTLLQSISRGIYDHIPGDGRECVVTDQEAVWVRAEDGRSVTGVDLRPFISNLPLGRDTSMFRTTDASGSTSQAAAVVEALELGATALLIDEDIAATNFMIRDARMRALIPAEEEPITPYLDRVEFLARERGVSSVLVVGGAGDYLSVADQVIQMESYLPRDVTGRARQVVEDIPSSTGAKPASGWPEGSVRIPLLERLDASRGKKRERVRSVGTREIQFGDEVIDLSLLEQLVDPAQARLIGDILLRFSKGQWSSERATLSDLVELVESTLDAEGILAVCSTGFGDRARPRKYELGGAINRLRALQVRDSG